GHAGLARGVLPGAQGHGVAAWHRLPGTVVHPLAGHRGPGQLLGAAAHQADRRAPRARRDQGPDPALLPDRELPARDHRHRAGHAGCLRHQPAADEPVRARAAAAVLPAPGRARTVAARPGVGAGAGAPRRGGAARDRDAERVGMARNRQAPRMALRLLACLLVAGAASAAEDEAGDELFRTLQAHDREFFERGFNQCDLEYLERAVHPELRFYHDQGGFQDYTAFMENTRKYICGDGDGKPIRKLDAGSLDVFPLLADGALYAAIQ